MAKKLLLILLSLNFFNACEETEKDCEEIRLEKPLYSGQKGERLDSLVALDLEVMRTCIEFDSIDAQILHPPVLSALFIQWENENEEIKYGDLIDKLEDLRSDEKFRNLRGAHEFSLMYENKIVDKADSLKIYQAFINMGVPESVLKEMLAEVYSERNANLTYKEAFSRSTNSKQRSEPAPQSDLLFGHFQELESLNKIAKGRSKPILLYFTGWANVRGRKMEEAFFSESEIQGLFEAYDCYIAYVDDRTPISAEQQKQFPDLPMRIKGQFLNQIQKSLGTEDYQPTIIILDSNLNVIDSFSYKMDNANLLAFLERNKDLN